MARARVGEEGERRRKKEKKEKKGVRKKKIGKRNKEKKKMGKRGKRERKRRGAVRASGDRGRGRPRVACGPREVGHAVEGERKKERGKKRGRDSRRPVTTRRVGWERDGT